VSLAKEHSPELAEGDARGRRKLALPAAADIGGPSRSLQDAFSSLWGQLVLGLSLEI